MKWSLLQGAAASYSNLRAGASFSTVTRSGNGGRLPTPARFQLAQLSWLHGASPGLLNNRRRHAWGTWQRFAIAQQKRSASCSHLRPLPKRARRPWPMSALFSFSSFLVVILLTICTCTYVKGKGAPLGSAPLCLHPSPAAPCSPAACSLMLHAPQHRACSTSGPGEWPAAAAAAVGGGARGGGLCALLSPAFGLPSKRASPTLHTPQVQGPVLEVCPHRRAVEPVGGGRLLLHGLFGRLLLSSRSPAQPSSSSYTRASSQAAGQHQLAACAVELAAPAAQLELCMAQSAAPQAGSSMPHEALNGAASPQGGSPPLGSSPPLGTSPFGAPFGASPPLGASPPGGSVLPRSKPPRPKPAIKLAPGTGPAAAGAGQPQAAAAGAALASGGGAQQPLPRPPSSASSSTSEGPLTFASPSVVAAELRQSAAATAPGGHAAAHAHQQPAGQPAGQAGQVGQASGVLRTSSGGVEPRLRRTVSWSDMENRAPLAQVVEYEPSEPRSVHSEDDWHSHPSGGCICTIQ